MATENANGHATVSWFVSPGESDHLAWVSFAFICLAIYGLVTLYAAFDRWAEHQSKGTPLAKTIPTMLTIALLYEIFPLGHFNILLPLAAILIALMADWSRFNLRNKTAPEPMIAARADTGDDPQVTISGPDETAESNPDHPDAVKKGPVDV